jgi:hypothetical protein
MIGHVGRGAGGRNQPQPSRRYRTRHHGPTADLTQPRPVSAKVLFCNRRPVPHGPHAQRARYEVSSRTATPTPRANTVSVVVAAAEHMNISHESNTALKAAA